MDPKLKPWKCIAITLNPEGERYKEFLKNNNHLKIKTFQGIIGKDLTKEEIIDQGLATRDLVYSPHFQKKRMGCSASHRSIWDKCAKGKKGYLVLEDDCYTHPEISDFIDDNLTDLMDMDICFFAVNTNSVLISLSNVGITSKSLFEPKNPSPNWIRNALSRTKIHEIKAHRLIHSFGYCAYFISPKGAEKLRQKVFPLSTKEMIVPLVRGKLVACGLDRSANTIYSEVDAYVCQPFLAYTPNIDSP